jgi:hypothetical protein
MTETALDVQWMSGIGGAVDTFIWRTRPCNEQNNDDDDDDNDDDDDDNDDDGGDGGSGGGGAGAKARLPARPKVWRPCQLDDALSSLLHAWLDVKGWRRNTHTIDPGQPKDTRSVSDASGEAKWK